MEGRVIMDYIYKERQRLARKANRRLRELEKAGYDRWAYSRAVEYIEQTLGKGRKRFSESEGKRVTRTRVYSDVRNLEAFLNSQTSTVEGQEALIQTREATLMRNWGIDLTTEEGRNDFYGFIDSLDFTSLDSEFKGMSKPIVRLYSEAYNSEKAYKTLKKSIQDYKKGKIKRFTTIEKRVQRSLGRL